MSIFQFCRTGQEYVSVIEDWHEYLSVTVCRTGQEYLSVMKDLS